MLRPAAILSSAAVLVAAGVAIVLAAEKPDPNKTTDGAGDEHRAIAPDADGKVVMSEAEWRELLTPEQFRVTRKHGTERAFGAAYAEFVKHGAGTYFCVGCGAELFDSAVRFHSGCGWPSFYDPSMAKNIVEREDTSGRMVRTEVLCAVCDAHLGHVFEGEGYNTPTDKRYCVNAAALRFVPAKAATADAKAKKPTGEKRTAKK